MQPPANTSNQQFPALTGIIAIAAFMVFFHHLPLLLKPNFLIGLQLSFFWGVTLFFVLSGFLITYRYYENFQLKGKWIWNYFVNRFARIYPVYFVVLTVVVLVIKNREFIFLLQNYTLTHNLFFLFNSKGLAIGPSWSLTVEETFYVLAPLFFYLYRKFNALVPVLITLFIFAILLLTFNGGVSEQLDLFAITFGTFFGHSLEFFAGAYLAMHLLKRKDRFSTDRRSVVFTITGLLLMGALVIPLIYATNKEMYFKNVVMMIVNNLLLPIPIALFYYGLITEKTWLRKFLSLSFMNFLGRVSYAFYLIHLPLIDYFGEHYLRSKIGPGHYNLYVIILFIIAMVLSIIVYLLIEKPANHFIRRKAVMKPGPALAQQVA